MWLGHQLNDLGLPQLLSLRTIHLRHGDARVVLICFGHQFRIGSFKNQHPVHSHLDHFSAVTEDKYHHYKEHEKYLAFALLKCQILTLFFAYC